MKYIYTPRKQGYSLSPESLSFLLRRWWWVAPTVPTSSSCILILRLVDVFLYPQRTYGLVDTESSIHLFLQKFETRGLLAISLKRPWTERRKRKSRDLGVGRR